VIVEPLASDGDWMIERRVEGVADAGGLVADVEQRILAEPPGARPEVERDLRVEVLALGAILRIVLAAVMREAHLRVGIEVEELVGVDHFALVVGVTRAKRPAIPSP